MAMDVIKWLTDDLGFTAEEAQQYAPAFTGRVEKLEKGYLRLSDYSRKMDEVAKAQKAVEENDAKLTRDMAEWAEMTAAEKAASGDLREKIEAAQTKAFQLEQKLIRVAEENGLDAKAILGGEPTPPKPAVVPQAYDDSAIRTQIGGVANYMLTLSAKLPRIAREHHELTGTELDIDAFVEGIKADIAAGSKNAELDPIKRWETQNNIPALRTTKAEERRTADLAAAREEGRLAALTEAALPNTHPPTGSHSPVLRAAAAPGHSKLPVGQQRPQPSQRLAGAISALATGKYRKTA